MLRRRAYHLIAGGQGMKILGAVGTKKATRLAPYYTPPKETTSINKSCVAIPRKGAEAAKCGFQHFCSW